jgi:hypothetical protein
MGEGNVRGKERIDKKLQNLLPRNVKESLKRITL